MIKNYLAIDGAQSDACTGRILFGADPEITKVAKPFKV